MYGHKQSGSRQLNRHWQSGGAVRKLTSPYYLVRGALTNIYYDWYSSGNGLFADAETGHKNAGSGFLLSPLINGSEAGGSNSGYILSPVDIDFNGDFTCKAIINNAYQDCDCQSVEFQFSNHEVESGVPAIGGVIWFKQSKYKINSSDEWNNYIYGQGNNLEIIDDKPMLRPYNTMFSQASGTVYSFVDMETDETIDGITIEKYKLDSGDDTELYRCNLKLTKQEENMISQTIHCTSYLYAVGNFNKKYEKIGTFDLETGISNKVIRMKVSNIVTENTTPDFRFKGSIQGQTAKQQQRQIQYEVDPVPHLCKQYYNIYAESGDVAWKYIPDSNFDFDAIGPALPAHIFCDNTIVM